MPGSTLFKDAVASGIAYENIAKNLTTDAGQIMKNAAVDGAYVFNKGDGADTINEYDPTAGNVDIAQFSNVASTAVRSIERKGGDLVIGYGTTDQFTVSNYFNGAA